MSFPELHAEMHNFTLPDLQGRKVSLWDYKQEQPVVLVFCDEEDSALLQDFKRHYAQYREDGAEVLMITPRRPSAQHMPFPVLLDREGQVRARFTERIPAVLILDSYNVLEGRFEGPWQAGLDHEAILRLITRLQMRCPECGVPEWTEWTYE